MDLEVILAKKAVAEYLNNGKIFQPATTLPDELLKKRAGVFVCLNRQNGARGCIGTVKPSQKNIAKEIITNAISAAVADNKFAPLRKEDLPDVSFAVYIIDKLKKIKNGNDLPANTYGIMVKSGIFRLKSAVILPDKNKYLNTEAQIIDAIKKAGLNPVKDQFAIYAIYFKKNRERAN